MKELTGAEGRHHSGKHTLEATFEDGSENLRHKICWRDCQGVKSLCFTGAMWFKRTHECSADLVTIFVFNLYNNVVTREDLVV